MAAVVEVFEIIVERRHGVRRRNVPDQRLGGCRIRPAQGGNHLGVRLAVVGGVDGGEGFEGGGCSRVQEGSCCTHGGVVDGAHGIAAGSARRGIEVKHIHRHVPAGGSVHPVGGVGVVCRVGSEGRGRTQPRRSQQQTSRYAHSHGMALFRETGKPSCGVFRRGRACGGSWSRRRRSLRACAAPR